MFFDREKGGLQSNRLVGDLDLIKGHPVHDLYFSGDGQNLILVIISLDAYQKQVSTVILPEDLKEITRKSTGYSVHDLLTERSYRWRGVQNYVELTPENPIHIFRIEG